MRKYITLVLALVGVLSLCSCGWNSQKAVATVFSENVTQVDITHRIGAETTNWSIEGAGIADLKKWFDSLDYRLIDDKDGQTPGDNNGNEVYTFAFTGGEWPGFSYVIIGENNCYIESEGNWFSVINTSNPPIEYCEPIIGVVEPNNSNTEPDSETPGAVVHVADIWDRTKTEQIACDTALEKFWEDETNEYCFDCIKSQYIIVMDSTGRTVDVVTALEEGLITIETLDCYGIKYSTEQKN